MTAVLIEKSDPWCNRGTCGSSADTGGKMLPLLGSQPSLSMHGLEAVLSKSPRRMICQFLAWLRADHWGNTHCYWDYTITSRQLDVISQSEPHRTGRRWPKGDQVQAFLFLLQSKDSHSTRGPVYPWPAAVCNWHYLSKLRTSEAPLENNTLDLKKKRRFGKGNTWKYLRSHSSGSDFSSFGWSCK